MIHVRSESPRSIAAVCVSTRPCGVTSISIRSGNPAGRAAVGRKRGLRTSTPPRRTSQLTMRYGPVPGGVKPGSSAWRGRAGGHDVGHRRRQLVQELRVGRFEVDRDRPRVRIRLDAAREVAPRPRADAPPRADDPAEVGREDRVAGRAQVALHRRAEVVRPDRRPVGVADAAPQGEYVRAPVLARPRRPRGQRADERSPATPETRR